jgi:hypothetical protein
VPVALIKISNQRRLAPLKPVRQGEYPDVEYNMESRSTVELRPDYVRTAGIEPTTSTFQR